MLLLKVILAWYPSIVSEDDDSIDLVWRLAVKINNTKRPRKQFLS